MKTVSLMSILLTLLTVGCATSPSDTITQVPTNDVSLAEVAPQVDKFIDAPVRWGGRIVKTTEVASSATINNADATEKPTDKPSLLVEILEFPLDARGEPLTSEPSSGRFMALIKPPYKKSAFYRNRYITVAGEITDKDERQLPNGQVQSFPIISSQDKYTWNSNDDHHRHRGFRPRILYGFGFGFSKRRRNFGFGVTFH